MYDIKIFLLLFVLAITADSAERNLGSMRSSKRGKGGMGRSSSSSKGKGMMSGSSKGMMGFSKGKGKGGMSSKGRRMGSSDDSSSDNHRNSNGGDSDSDDSPKVGKLELRITNLAYQQPFGPFFVMIHNERAEPLFTLGDPPSDELAVLAEAGNPGPLVGQYSGARGVGDVFAFSEGVPYFLGGSFVIPVTTTKDYPYVTIASMAINTNDVFVSINGMKLQRGDIISSVGYDAGSEENNELCISIPGPACANINTQNVRSLNGEGYVHVSRGFHGVGPDLSQSGYDWRNPMMRVQVW